ncbi:tetratricopeptide repeat protein [Variovorax defluvii]|uniref:Tetratricopeptide repeat protein n=1 Tax=Variovorax defluvii TaxID=913761 RepID=A0ABP8I2J9_9BURK
MSNPSHSSTEAWDPDLALARAVQLHNAGRIEEAEPVYDRILEALPDHAETLHFKGLAVHQRGRHAEAIALIRAAIALNGEQFGWHCNLGNVLLMAGQADAAADAYEQALRLAPPGYADIHNNLGVLLHEQRRFEKAEFALRRALELDPFRSEVHANLGRLLLSLGRLDEAQRCLEEALRLNPDLLAAYPLLALVHRRSGRLAEAARVFRDCLAQAPGDPIALHHLAACAGEAAPERAADAYVERLFDTSAGNFDKTLGGLDYRGPALVAEAVAQCLGEPAHALDVLDAGCGTGLCGPVLAPYACRLRGVDLSQRMLDKAQARQVYDALEKAELGAYLEIAQPGSYDLIVSADTLCYFGELRGLFRAAAKALRPQGWLVFTAEASEGQDGAGFQLHPHGRYSHRDAYLREALAQAGLAVHELRRAPLRSEAGEAVQAWVVSCRNEAPRSF